jgi:hypothetical protein
MSDDRDKKALRAYLNSSIRGKNTDAILESVATGTQYLRENVEAINNQLYIVKAVGRYLDARLADSGLTRPENVGLSDEVFREIGIEVVNRKQVRDLLLNILRIVYGEDFTRATMDSDEFEPYALEDGDTLIIQYDDTEPVEVVFSAADFSNINNASAQEVADAITKQLNSLGANGAAFDNDDGVGAYVRLISEVDGPSSSIRVLGGKAQNKLKFPSIRPTSGQPTTEWTLSVQPGGVIRATWTNGPNPSIGKVRRGNYVNIYGSAFNIANQGTFTVTLVKSGDVGEAYVEFENPNGVDQVTNQGTVEGILFFSPDRTTVISKPTYATLYHVQDSLLEIFIPATTRVVRRERIGAAHIHESGPSGEGNEGPYIYDETKPYVISENSCLSSTNLNAASSNFIEVDDSSAFPDEEGFLVFGFGTAKEEGPVPYIARPSSTTLVLDPSYRFKNTHAAGTDITLIAQNFPIDVKSDGTDRAAYITDTVSGRVYAEELIELVSATGINVAITILYPDDTGLGKWGTENSEKVAIWGEDPV